MILKWLNGRNGGNRWFSAAKIQESKSRVTDLLTGMQDLFALLEGNDGDQSPRRAPWRISQQVQLVNQMLVRYKSSHHFRLDPKSRVGCEVSEIPLDQCPAGEVTAVNAAVRLAKLGRLRKVKTCDYGEWFFARFPHQRFCSDECRETFWEQSEDRKEQKRNRARENYVYNKVHKNQPEQKTKDRRGA